MYLPPTVFVRSYEFVDLLYLSPSVVFVEDRVGAEVVGVDRQAKCLSPCDGVMELGLVAILLCASGVDAEPDDQKYRREETTDDPIACPQGSMISEVGAGSPEFKVPSPVSRCRVSASS